MGCEIKNAVLPVLKTQRKDAYTPLSLDLKKGASVLFGANMTGKTTALKTIYFHLTAIRTGLPVPAEAITLHFPNQVAFHLKSPGDIKKKLSGFGEEIVFFTKEISPGAYFLVDELFQSTDPVNGVKLSQIFLSAFSQKEMIFFCTSHYPDLLNLTDISLYWMKDVDYNQKMPDLMAAEDLLSKIPFEIERIYPDNIENVLKNSRTPLAIALHFNLPETIKEKIRDRLKG